MKLDSRVNYLREDQITAVGLLMTSKCIIDLALTLFRCFSLYIHGGRDIKEGPMNNMWRLSVNGVQELIDDSEYGVAWEPVT